MTRAEIVRGWTIKKEVSAGTILTAMLVAVAGITWGLQLESRVDVIKDKQAVHATLEAHAGQRLSTTELIAEQRAIRSEIIALRQVNTAMKSELKEIRVYLFNVQKGDLGGR